MERLKNTPRGVWIAAPILALVAAWQLPAVIAVPESAAGFWAVSAAALIAFAALLWAGLPGTAKRHARVVWPLGFAYACFAMLGKPMNTARALPVWDGWAALSFLAGVAAYTAVFAAFLALSYRAVQGLSARAAAKPPQETGARKESLLSRLTGNGFAAALFVLLCWVPVWLAFYPGTFRYDADTQYASYVDSYLTTHHPLLHTLLMSWLLDLGNGWESLTLGVALYSAAQMLCMAAIVGVACAWLRRRGAPLALRVLVLLGFALWPLFPLWAISATKDVLFAGLTLLLCLQLIDVWQTGAGWLRSVWHVLKFVLTAALMMLFRNNGVYALCLALPFLALAARGFRIRALVLLAACVGVFALGNMLLINVTEAGGGSYVEMLSVPLQQTVRAAVRGNLTDEQRETLDELYAEYEGEYADLYTPMSADSAKWNLTEDVLSAEPARYVNLWWQVGLQNPRLYAEAFLEQNLPYYYPTAKMLYNIVLGVLPMDLYELTEAPVLPALRPFYEAYDRTLTVFGLSVTELLSDCAVMVWLTLWLLGLAVYRDQRGLFAAALLLLCVWATCLLGPVAAMRYLLALHYTVPVLLCYAAVGGGATGIATLPATRQGRGTRAADAANPPAAPDAVHPV